MLGVAVPSSVGPTGCSLTLTTSSGAASSEMLKGALHVAVGITVVSPVAVVVTGGFTASGPADCYG